MHAVFPHPTLSEMMHEFGTSRLRSWDTLLTKPQQFACYAGATGTRERSFTMFASRSKKAPPQTADTHGTRDRAGFDREVETLLRTRPRVGAAEAGEAHSSARAVLGANHLLRSGATFPELRRDDGGQGTSLRVQVNGGQRESFPAGAAAEFYFGLLGVPGLSECFIRFESEDGDWLVTSRPRLDGKGSRYNSGKKAIKNDRFAHDAEAVLQQFLRLAI